MKLKITWRQLKKYLPLPTFWASVTGSKGIFGLTTVRYTSVSQSLIYLQALHLLSEIIKLQLCVSLLSNSLICTLALTRDIVQKQLKTHLFSHLNSS